MILCYKFKKIKGISKKSANAILIKPNQVGTVSETLDAINLAHENKFQTVISHDQATRIHL